MPIFITCECGQQLQTREENAGRKARCPFCGRATVVPGASRPEVEFLGETGVWEGSSRWASRVWSVIALVLGLWTTLVVVAAPLSALLLVPMGLVLITAVVFRWGVLSVTIATVFVSVLLVLSVILLFVVPLVFPADGFEAADRAECTGGSTRIVRAMRGHHDQWGSYSRTSTTDAEGRPPLVRRVLPLHVRERTLATSTSSASGTASISRSWAPC